MAGPAYGSQGAKALLEVTQGPAREAQKSVIMPEVLQKQNEPGKLLKYKQLTKYHRGFLWNPDK